ncbi:MAG: hypothetical protein ABI904_08455 [Chloroflexota bacterium]
MVGGVTCPNCGKDNPDFLDNCQFCQAVLRSESTLNTGENPTKKVTAELEEILPDWLRDARQQSRDSAEEESKKEATKPKVQKEEPADLLAGLAFQAASDEDEVPDWLAAINPVEKKAAEASKPAEGEPLDFFAQFNQPTKESDAPAPVETSTSDELTSWLPEASQSDEPLRFDSGTSQGENDWMNNLGATVSHEPEPWAEPAKPAEPENLGWLHDLESSTKQPPATPSADMGWMSNLDSASTSGSQEDLSWLNSLGGVPASPDISLPAQPASSADDLSWLNDLGGTPAPSFDTPAQPASSQEDLSWLNNLGNTPAPSFDTPTPVQPPSTEDLSWLNNLGGTPASSSDASAQPAASSQEDLDWLNNLGGTPAPSFDTPTPVQSASTEDLSWLNNLGGTPAPSFDAPAQPAASSQDLDWLNNLGDTPAPSFDAPTSAQPASTEDLSWLNNLGGTSAPSFDAPAQPAASSQEDLDWLNNLDGTPAPSFDAPAQPASSQEDLGWLSSLDSTPAPSFDTPAQPVSPQEDLDWLSNLGGAPAPSFDAPVQPAASAQDLGWLNNLDDTPTPSASEPVPTPFLHTDQLKSPDASPDTPVTAFSPRHTAPLSEEAHDSMPDWLKSATAASSMPPLGATTMDWFDSKEKTADEDTSQTFGQTQGTPASAEQNLFAASSDASSLSNQEIDSLLSADNMPDWLSQAEPTTESASAQGGTSSVLDDSLAPVNLPSWVQAMRPVESAISSDVSAVSMDQNTEKEGPLVGLRGVIPFAPIGSALRPKSISIKLQATEEQLASAALFEQILAGETTAHPLKSTPFVASQRILRRALSAIFLIVLGTMIAMGTTQVPVSAALPVAVSNASNVVATMPDQAQVLVVVDYEPALSGEMEAVAGPLLDQMTVLRHPTYSFISTSPNGSALAERLMTNTKINRPGPDGLGYQLGSQYFNLGYLPGGSAGVRGFAEQPKTIMPLVNVNQFSDYAVVIVITDHAESGLVWIEQLELMKQTNPALAGQPLLMVASSQAGPLLQPYVLSKQVAGMISGLADAARYEFVNNSRPGIARSYWDAFGVGLFMAILAIVLGSLWSLFTTIRARRAEAEQG